MKNHRTKPIRLLAGILLIAAFNSHAAAQVTLTGETITLPTYPLGPDEPHALFKDYKLPGFKIFRGDRSVYPYTLQEEFSAEKQNMPYHAVTLENQYLRTQVITSLRGRLQGAYDKRNNFDFIYYNHVIKPQDIAIRKAWISGGLEWNHPGGHGYNQFGKVSHITREYDDGSKSVIVSEIEPVRNMKWQTEVKLSPERLYVETTCRLYSIAPYPMQFASSLNGAMHTSDELEVTLPKGSHYTGHGKNTMWEWPEFKGTDYSWLKNIQRTFSVFIEGEGLRQDYWGCYSHDEDIDAGTVIVADHRFAPGKKYFTWGYHDKGRIWDTLLSDHDGGYIELQQQAFWDNLGYGHAWLNPLEMKEFTVYWYPIKNMGGFVKANKDLAINIRDKGNRNVLIAAQATRLMEAVTIRVSSEGKTVFEKTTPLVLDEPFRENFKLPRNVPYDNLTLSLRDRKGNLLMDYFTGKVSFETPPLPGKPENPREMTMDELFQKGKSFYQDPFCPEAQTYFEAMLSRDSLDSRANRAMGLIYFFRGQYGAARAYYETSLINDHLNEGFEAHYYLGYCYLQSGEASKSNARFRTAETRSNKFVFPYRQASLPVLEAAVSSHEPGANGWMYLGKLYAYLRQHDRAIQSWKKSLSLEPRNAYALHNLGTATWYVEKDLEKSTGYLEKALEVAPHDGRLILELDHLYIGASDEEKRRELYRSHEKTVRDDDVLVLRWTDLLIHTGEFELAVDLMDNTYFFPKEMNYNQPYVHTRYAEAHYGLGEQMLSDGQYQQALQEFITGSKYPGHLNDIYPARAVNARLNYLKGLAYEGMGEDTRARQQWNQVIESNSREQAESDYYKALALFKTGDKQAGEDLLESLIIHHTEKIKSGEPDEDARAISHFILSRVFDYQGKTQEAAQHRQKAVALNAGVVIETRLEATFVPNVDM